MTPSQRNSSFKLYKTVGLTSLWQVRGAPARSPFFYEAGVIIDLDGASRAYAPRGSGLEGLDLLGNAVAISDKAGRSPWLRPPRKQTDAPTNPLWTPTYKSTVRDPRTGASITQAEGPDKGFYISESSLKDVYHGVLGAPQTDPAYQTDAATFPYIVLPQRLVGDAGVQVGDYALAIHGASGRYSFAQYGDAKNAPVMGESSSALAKALGLRHDRRGGTPRGIVYLVFPNSGLGPKLRSPLSLLEDNGRRWLQLYNDRIDLAHAVISCFTPEHPGVARAFAQLGC